MSWSFPAHLATEQIKSASDICPHDVFYRGFREGKGIWGTWEIGSYCGGGFHIWPRQAGEWEEAAVSAEAEAPVDAIAGETGVLCGSAEKPLKRLTPRRTSEHRAKAPVLMITPGVGVKYPDWKA